MPFTSLLRIPRKAYLITAVLYMGGIYYLSSIHIPIEEEVYPFFWSFCANFFHFPLYMGLGMLLLLGLRTETGSLNTRTVFAALCIVALYGAFDEYHQSWTGRNCSVTDFFIDVLGGIAAAVFLKSVLEKTISLRRFLIIFFVLIFFASVCAVWEIL
jgi:VanZ family protein